MPKMRSNRGACKRFKTTGSGSVKRHHAYAGHKFTCKTRKQKRRLRSAVLVHSTNERNIKRMISC
jgi:large subunit ribosomal protein L35